MYGQIVGDGQIDRLVDVRNVAVRDDRNAVSLHDLPRDNHSITHCRITEAIADVARSGRLAIAVPCTVRVTGAGRQEGHVCFEIQGQAQKWRRSNGHQ